MCLNPQCALLPLKGGCPVFHFCDLPAGEEYLHRDHGLCKVIYLPCGKCSGCIKDRMMDITALQCCEASLHTHNWFLTLTYDDWKTYELTETFPRSLVRSHLTDFLVSMRKYCAYNKARFRYFACGEYGSQSFRPHYHLSVFGLDPSLLGLLHAGVDEEVQRDQLYNSAKLKHTSLSRDENGNIVYHSPVIASRWKFGNHKLYRANRQTFQYIAGYVTKKLEKSDLADDSLSPEFRMQSRPSIGKPWFDKFYTGLSIPFRDQIINDSIDLPGLSWRIPRIFSKWAVQLDQFDGKKLVDRLSTIRQQDLDYPDRADLARKSDFEKYRASHYKQEKHNEGIKL